MRETRVNIVFGKLLHGEMLEQELFLSNGEPVPATFEFRGTAYVSPDPHEKGVEWLIIPNQHDWRYRASLNLKFGKFTEQSLQEHTQYKQGYNHAMKQTKKRKLNNKPLCWRMGFDRAWEEKELR